MPTLADCHIALMDLFFIALGTCIASQGCFPSWDGGAYASVTFPPLAHLHICSCSASPCALCALAPLDCDGVAVRWLRKEGHVEINRQRHVEITGTSASSKPGFCKRGF